MSGRRSHVRFAVVRAPQGVLRVMHDVIVEHATSREVVAISREPGVSGEPVVIEFPAAEPTGELRAQVVESHPVVVNGTIRHRLRLQALGAASPQGEAESDPR
jgi:hypothetical protein